MAIRPVVCLGQVAHHESVPGGYEVLLHGVCRATISEVLEPFDDRPWCEAKLRPLESLDEEPPSMPEVGMSSITCCAVNTCPRCGRSKASCSGSSVMT